MSDSFPGSCQPPSLSAIGASARRSPRYRVVKRSSSMPFARHIDPDLGDQDAFQIQRDHGAHSGSQHPHQVHLAVHERRRRQFFSTALDSALLRIVGHHARAVGHRGHRSWSVEPFATIPRVERALRGEANTPGWSRTLKRTKCRALVSPSGPRICLRKSSGQDR